MTFSNIVTNRLVIRNLMQSDAPLAFSIWGDIEMGKYLHDPYYKDVEELFNTLKDIEQDPNYAFIAFCKDTQQFIGTCSIYPEDDPKHWDIGYCVHKDFWKHGYGSEMVKALIAFAYDKGARIITAHVAQENQASCALMKSCGFIIDSETSSKKIRTDIVYPTYIFKLTLK